MQEGGGVLRCGMAQVEANDGTVGLAHFFVGLVVSVAEIMNEVYQLLI